MRHRSELVNARKVAALWAEHNSTIRKQIADATASLLRPIPPAERARVRDMAEAGHGRLSKERCFVLDPSLPPLLRGGSRKHVKACANVTSLAQGVDAWSACLDGWEPAHSCLLLSVGRGGGTLPSVGFEGGMALAFGCEAHAVRLAAGGAALPPYDGVGPVQLHTAAKRRGGAYPAIHQLSRLFERHAGKRDVDVLTVDCKGCEWALFACASPTPTWAQSRGATSPHRRGRHSSSRPPPD